MFYPKFSFSSSFFDIYIYIFYSQWQSTLEEGEKFWGKNYNNIITYVIFEVFDNLAIKKFDLPTPKILRISLMSHYQLFLVSLVFY